MEYGLFTLPTAVCALYLHFVEVETWPVEDGGVHHRRSVVDSRDITGRLDQLAVVFHVVVVDALPRRCRDHAITTELGRVATTTAETGLVKLKQVDETGAADSAQQVADLVVGSARRQDGVGRRRRRRTPGGTALVDPEARPGVVQRQAGDRIRRRGAVVGRIEARDRVLGRRRRQSNGGDRHSQDNGRRGHHMSRQTDTHTTTTTHRRLAPRPQISRRRVDTTTCRLRY